ASHQQLHQANQTQDKAQLLKVPNFHQIGIRPALLHHASRSPISNRTRSQIHTNLRSSTNQTPQTDSILESPDFFQLKNCSPFILELKHNHAERPPAAGDTGGSNFSSLVRVRERQWLARSVAISAAGSSPGAARSATCAGSDSRRQRATVDDGSSARVSVSGQRWRL
ncbi:hypothetical protein Drorol1_Dr00026267, partial [Drosera rotundifolia]